MSEETFSVSLRIWHPALSDEAVINAIGMKPEFRQSVGSPRINPAGQALEGLYRSTYCSFVLVQKVPGVFTDGLRGLLSSLQAQGDFFRRVTLEGGRSELFVGVFTESSTGFTFDAKSLMAIANLSLDISVEIYY